MKNPIYAHIDLTTGKTRDIRISREYLEKYFGGKAMACRLLLDLTQPKIPPLDQRAMLIVNTGPMADTGAPCSGRFNISFKSVLTGSIASSDCGGDFGIMLKRAGYDGLLLVGKAEKLSVLEIVDGEIKLSNAEALASLNTDEAQARLPDAYGKLVIGPAGEHIVHYACIVSGERVAGRGGGGALLGSKNIKAIIAYGTKTNAILKHAQYTAFVKKWAGILRAHPMTGEHLPRFGSAMFVESLNEAGALPTQNFNRGSFSYASDIDGKAFSKHMLLRNSGCIACPIRCERRTLFEGKEIRGPEYSEIAAFGSNILCNDQKSIVALTHICVQLGLDPISAASTLAFAMELYERGIADFSVEFQNTKNLPDILKKIAYRDGYYATLANGSKWLGERFGGEKFAVHINGMEMDFIEPRKSVGMGLFFATSNHLPRHYPGADMAIFESMGIFFLGAQSTKNKPELTILTQNILEAVLSLGYCPKSLFASIPAAYYKRGKTHMLQRVTRFVLSSPVFSFPLLIRLPAISSLFLSLYLPHIKAFRYATNLNISGKLFLRMGERAFHLDRIYNMRENDALKHGALPARFLTERLVKDDPFTVVPLHDMLLRYYRLRGWDQNGMPMGKKLEKMEIE